MWFKNDENGLNLKKLNVLSNCELEQNKKNLVHKKNLQIRKAIKNVLYSQKLIWRVKVK